ncbi:MAG: formyltransferase family protein [Pirellulales bacterium]
MNTIPPLRLAVLISGGGTTLRNLQTHILDKGLPATIGLVVSSNPASVGLALAAEHGIATATITTKEFPDVAAFSAKIFDACRAARRLRRLRRFFETPDDSRGLRVPRPQHSPVVDS